MKKILLSFVILSFLSLILPKTILADDQANKFGLHILEPADTQKANEIINSSGGDWGWVTIVIRDDDMNFDKWQGFMDLCREKHLIPLVRIATHLEGSSWVKPKKEDAEKWASFLGNLNWPISDQYVIIFNEPNHTKEWGGEVNPKEYARILSEFINKFHSLNSKFLILNSGLDLAAPNSSTTIDALKFMNEMNFEVPEIFEKLDGWTSHSYPNHGFLGKPWETGRTSVKGYEWELSILKNTFGVNKNLPVFITETGWPVNSAKFKVQSPVPDGTGQSSKLPKYYDETTVSTYLKYAFENVWLKDDQVKAVTPFVFNYPGELFANFSWLDKDGNPYQRCEIIKNVEKTFLWPEQKTEYQVISLNLPPFLPVITVFQGEIALKNVGQTIWGDKEVFSLLGKSTEGINVSNLTLDSKTKIKPNQLTTIKFILASSEKVGEFNFSWGDLPNYKLKVLPSSFLTQAQYSFWEKVILKIKNFTKIF